MLGRAALDGLLVDELVLDYRLELARQEEAGDNPASYSADFSHLGAGLSWRGWRLGVAREVLGADRDAGVALQTPLATLHAFQGWADKFLSTPTEGLEDRFVGITGQVASVKLQATWHHYQADVGGQPSAANGTCRPAASSPGAIPSRSSMPTTARRISIATPASCGWWRRRHSEFRIADSGTVCSLPPPGSAAASDAGR